MSAPRGRIIRLSPARKFIGDLVHFAKQVPTVPVQRQMKLAPLVAARRRCVARPSWAAIFLKGYALVAAAAPDLRRAFLTFPSDRLYEHPENVASVAVEREVDGEPAVLFAHLRTPDQKSLTEIDGHLRRFKEEPVRNFGLFRRALFVSKFPCFLRRFLWWANLSCSGPMRAKRFGTFGLSVYAGLGASSLHPLSPLTTCLNYGPFEDDGTIDVRVMYDHRVLDGAVVARVLGALEETLLSAIQGEVEELARQGEALHRSGVYAKSA